MCGVLSWILKLVAMSVPNLIKFRVIKCAGKGNFMDFEAVTVILCSVFLFFLMISLEVCIVYYSNCNRLLDIHNYCHITFVELIIVGILFKVGLLFTPLTSL